VDMHATDLVGINGFTRVLLVYKCQQGVYPRGHVLPLRLPNTLYQILLWGCVIFIVYIRICGLFNDICSVVTKTT
jgi:hypothetical protein